MTADDTVWSGSISWRAVMASVGLLLWARWRTRYVVTESTISRRKGIIANRTSSIRVADVRNIEVEQGVWNRILGIGHISFSTAGTGGTEVTFTSVTNPGAIRNRVQELQQASQ